jgi:hypothetical protein
LIDSVITLKVLWYEDVAIRALEDLLYGLPLEADNSMRVLVGQRHRVVRTWERVEFSDSKLEEAFLDLSVFCDNLLDQNSCPLELVWGALYEDVSQICVWDFFLRYLDFAAALLLQCADRITSFADDQTHTFVWDWHDLGERRWGTIRCQKVVVNDRLFVNVTAHPISGLKLLVPD